MSRRLETQDPVFSTQIVNAYLASSAKSSRLTQRKATMTLLNTSFQQWQFATLCRSNSDPDVIACSQGELFVAISGDVLAAMRLPAATLVTRLYNSPTKGSSRSVGLIFWIPLAS